MKPPRPKYSVLESPGTPWEAQGLPGDCKTEYLGALGPGLGAKTPNSGPREPKYSVLQSPGSPWASQGLPGDPKTEPYISILQASSFPCGSAGIVQRNQLTPAPPVKVERWKGVKDNCDLLVHQSYALSFAVTQQLDFNVSHVVQKLLHKATTISKA